MNLYCFVGNNPLAYTDPDGREPVTTVVVATTLTASSGGGSGATLTLVAGGSTAVGGSTILPIAAGVVALPLAGATLFAMANTPPPLVYYPAGGNPIPTSVSMPIGVTLKRGEHWDPNTDEILDAAGNRVRDNLGRPAERCSYDDFTKNFPGGFSDFDFGTEIHQRFEAALHDLYGTRPGDWLIRTGVGETGVDAEYIGPTSRDPGFRYAELKSYSKNGIDTFVDQVGIWDLAPGQTQLFFYNRGGIIGSSGLSL
jgi:hypothetical protein